MSMNLGVAASGHETNVRAEATDSDCSTYCMVWLCWSSRRQCSMQQHRRLWHHVCCPPAQWHKQSFASSRPLRSAAPLQVSTREGNSDLKPDQRDLGRRVRLSVLRVHGLCARRILYIRQANAADLQGDVVRETLHLAGAWRTIASAPCLERCFLCTPQRSIKRQQMRHPKVLAGED